MVVYLYRLVEIDLSKRVRESVGWDACCPRCDVKRSWIVGFLSDAMRNVLAKRDRWKVEKKRKERRLKTGKKWMGRKCERKEKNEEKEESSAKELGTSKKG